MPNVTWMRPELKRMLASYDLVDDCIEGEARIKWRKSRYLPVPNSADLSNENVQRYVDYTLRAQFFNATGRTLEGLVGQVFIRTPQVTLPGQLEKLRDNATGLGLDLHQLTKMAVKDGLSKGRAGLFTDYPEVQGGVASRTEVETLNLRPTIEKIEAAHIINWRYSTTGGNKRLTLVVFKQKYIENDDGFELRLADQYRVLELQNNVYSQSIWRNKRNAPHQRFTPTDAKGNTFDEIPFEFIGSENNDPDIDPAPMYHLASVNIGHYRNSADYEESVFMLGQPTAYFAGLKDEWVKNVLGDTVYLGSRRILPLPEGASAGILQVSPNTLAFEAMKHKEAQMVALGAKLVQNRSVQRTAFETDIDNTSEMSTLSSVASNVGKAFLRALKSAAKYTGDDPSQIKFDINSAFDLINLSPEERLQLIKEWQAGAITWTEYRNNLRRAGIATEIDDVKARTAIVEEMQSRPVPPSDVPNNDAITSAV